MALTILSQPEEITSIYSIDGDNLAFVLESTESALCSMKYVGDLYVNGNYITTVKNSPNLVDGKCVMIFNRIIEDFISSDKNTTYFQTSTNSYATYSVIFGEETDGTYDCSNGTFDILYGPSFSGNVWNGTIQYGEAFDSTDWEMGNNSGGADFLTNSPDEQTIYITENSQLHWLTGTAMGQSVEVSVTDDTNTTTIYYILSQSAVRGQVSSIGTGPVDINDYVIDGIVRDQGFTIMTQSIIDCSTVTYSVQLREFPVTTTTVSKIKYYNVLCDCNRFTPYRIVWLNKRGGYDSYTFRLKSTRTITTESKEWSRYLSSLQPDDSFSYQVGDRGRSVYSSRAFEGVTVVSEWMSAEDHNWVAELFESPDVYYMQFGPVYIPIVITKKSVEIRDKKGWSNRLLSHTIEFVYANERVNQRG